MSGKDEEMALNDSDYMYSSARIRAMENSLLTNEKLARMAEAKSVSEVYGMMAEAGVPVPADENGRPDAEAAFDDLLGTAYRTVEGMTPDPALFAAFRYPYDAANLKAALKAMLSGKSDDGMISPLGTVSPEALAAAVSDMDFTAFPRNLEIAAYAACDEYSKTGDPQMIDFIIDRACFADLSAAMARDAFCGKMTRIRIDLINIITCLRTLRFGKVAVKRFDRSFLDGGNLPLSLFREALSGARLFDRMKYGEYASLVAQLEGCENSFGEMERLCDDYWMEKLKDAKYITFGAGVSAAYLFAREYEVKNLRILLAGKAAEMPPEKIRERMRTSYV